MNELLDFVLKEKITIISPHTPFTWASGAVMPIYNDNRVLLSSPKGRSLVAQALTECALTPTDTDTTPHWDYVAGIATAGIAPGVLLAEALNTQFIYVRAQEKKHGLHRTVEGLSPKIWQHNNTRPLSEKRVLIVEDTLSTGSNAVHTARILHTHGATHTRCVAIFTYGFDAVRTAFSTLSHPCEILSIITLDALLNRAMETHAITDKDMHILQEWKKDPFNWAATHHRNTV